MLDAYIIEEIKKRDDARRIREDAERPRLHIDIPGWPPAGPDTDVEVPSDPTRDEHDDEDGGAAPDPIRIDL